jgi:hypothetical protein
MRSVNLTVVSAEPLPERAWTLTADLADRITQLKVSPPKHRSVGSALSQALPDVSFRLVHVYTGMVYRPGRLLDASGGVIAPRDPLKWVEDELVAAQQCTLNPNAWRDRYNALRASGLVRTAYRITPLYFAGRAGRGPADYWQAVVDMEQEYPGPELPDVGDPKHLDIYSEAPEESQLPIGAAMYRLRQVEHIGEFVERAAAVRRREYPQVLQSALERSVAVADFTPTGVISYVTSEAEVFGLTSHPGLAHLQRWFQDWCESSARDTPVEDHWRFELHQGVWKDKPYCDATPQWVTRRALPRSSKARISNDVELRTWMERFDARAGHRMAWYFFMLHGNRITGHFGERVHDAVGRGAVLLPERDRKVLQRWVEKPYGF